MHITCPNCSTKFSLPDEMFKEGAQARCTVCDEVFSLIQTPEHNVEVEPQEDPFVESLEAKETIAPEGDTDTLIGGEGTFGLGEPKKKEKSGKGCLIFFLILTLLGGACAGVWYLAPDLVKRFLPMEEKAESLPTSVANDVSRISLKNISQYYITNEKIGQVFVIEGDAENRFGVPKELIKVEATLYDANNVAIASKQQLGGSGVSLFQLQVLAKEELADALNNKVEILTNNTNVMPTKSVHFMVVFYDPPKNVAEFGVKVVEAKNPPIQ
ncbi:zinc-ribbon and DUF3426 domain-containing protein [Halodesulfovibrio marinisediminis]|uniref:Zinc-ribbon domain-containing protein n=1 Tax=Halodesulfovibrio marinisediminis DSM 17456 TaxID=1121457 RepID=A0A1N6E3N6_9BACT|nr:zinc-ribbon and DUF3426 domain-containing protein [Halodesulfovibrio marinisediminis]SIN77636.1 zinc-ribbon domain-containing protein [Halodesulfovibrio marinisediminis DSM 17456]